MASDDRARPRTGPRRARRHVENRAVEAGLDALDTAPRPARRRRGSAGVFVRSVLPPIVFLALLVGVWQLAYLAEMKPSVRAAVAGRRGADVLGRRSRTAGPPRRSGPA